MTDPHKRAIELLARMNLDEKIAQLHAIWLTVKQNGAIGVRNLTGVRQTEIELDAFSEMRHGIGQITRPLGTSPRPPEEGARILNRVQKFLVTETRLKIPALPHEESLAGLMAEGATLFPAGINNGALWDERLVEKMASAIGNELYAVGARQGLSPVLDVCRDARWGRTEECFAEDPYLVGCLATAYVRGLQGENGRIVATLKHFAGHSFSEGGRNHAPVRIGPRELNDTFLLPFEMAIKLARAASVMPAYHDIDGEPLHQSRTYLAELLRGRWNFEGTIVSDYEGVSQLHTDHRTQMSLAAAAAAALRAGVDVELPGGTAYAEGLKIAIRDGLIEPALVDRAVMRVLKQKFRLGLFENPYSDEAAVALNTPEHRAIAAEAAAGSIVLLKNDGVLPLASGGTVALIGPVADDPLAMLGGYSFPVHLVAARIDGATGMRRTLRTAFEERGVQRVLYSRGCDILTGRPTEAAVFPGELGVDGSSQQSCISRDESQIPAAVETARQADLIILAVGDLAGLFLSGTVGEGSDVSSLALPGVQMKLMDTILDLGKPVVIVVAGGRPYNIGRGFREASAVIHAGLPGEAGPQAITDVLYGTVNPGGKLPVSIPRTAGAMPFFYNHKLKSAGTPIQPEFGAEYPFGFGLSYTTFELSGFELPRATVSTADTVEIRCEIANRGIVPGDEVVQLYVRDLYASSVRPVMELKAFKRVRLEPGETARLLITVPCDMLSFTGEKGDRIVEPGDFEFMIGTSSRDILFRRTVTVEGPLRTLPENWNMQSSVEVERSRVMAGS